MQVKKSIERNSCFNRRYCIGTCALVLTLRHSYWLSKRGLVWIKTKIGLDYCYEDVINALCYTTYKGRWEFFDIIFDAKYKNIHLSVPRGFRDESQFREFSQDIRQMLGGEFGDDIRIQGSSLMALPGPVKDIDLAIVMDEQEYLQALKKAFDGEYFKYKTGQNRNQMPADYARSISDEDFLGFID